MDRTFSLEKFAEYWFGTFAVVVLMGEEEEIKDDGRDWERECLGTFYIKPNYPGGFCFCFCFLLDDRA